MKLAYFINQYPKVSHSFIRREIMALERLGYTVERYALRTNKDELVDPLDQSELSKTRYVLSERPLKIGLAFIKTFYSSPLLLYKAFKAAIFMGLRSDRGLILHLIYVIEACVLLQWEKTSGIYHIHAHFGTNSTTVVMLAYLLGGVGYSFTVHGPEEFDKPEFIHLAQKIHYCRFVVAISSYGRSQLYRWVRHDQWVKVKIVHCGLERAFYDIPPVPIPVLSRLVCVGRLCEQKGQLLLIEAAHQLKEQNIAFELILAGDGEMRADIEALVDLYGLRDRVRITGWISSDRVREELLAAQGLVLPSFAEGLPVVIMEAMALRRPVLSTFVAGIPELAQPGENSWLFQAGSVEDLTSALLDFLSTPKDVLQRMGEAGYKRVLERHSIDIEAGKLAALFREYMPN